MKREERAATIAELLVIGVIAFLLVLLALPLLIPHPDHSRRMSCNSYLGQIVKACTTYQEPNGDFFPYFGDGSGQDNPMMSLALLYPAYIDNVKVFRCPQTEDSPELTISKIRGVTLKQFGPVTGEKKCSYMYDSRAHFRTIGPLQAMAADADGQSWILPDGTKPDYPATWTRIPRKPNHQNGQNVMYFAGHIKWKESNYASDDPLDNIYCPNTLPGPTPQPWDPDTDAYLWDGANPRRRQGAD